MNKLSYLDTTLVFFLLIFSVIPGFFGLFELSLGISAAIPLILMMRLSVLDGSLETRMLSISYSISQFICWVIGFLGCIYFLSPKGFNIGTHTVVTMVLINLVMWGSLLGTLIAEPFKKFQSKSLNYNEKITNELTSKGFQITGAIFAFFLVVNYFSGGFFSRQQIGNTVEPGTVLYFLSAFSTLQYLFFLFLGFRLNRPLLNKSNIVNLIIVLFSMLIASLTGGRGMSIRMLIYTILGSFYSKLKSKDIKKFIVISIPFVLFFTIIIGNVRGNLDFSESINLVTRITLIGKAATGNLEATGSDYDDPLYSTFTRIAEPTGQIVIDHVAETGSYIGLRNFERIATAFMPKILGDKEPMDDGGERLRDEYGVYITQFTNAPITSMADAFERGGYGAVFIFSLIMSFYLTKLSGYIGRLKKQLLRITLRISFAYTCSVLYAPSILGCISVVTYNFLKDGLLIWALIFVLEATTKKIKNLQ
ncbi:hypothetical protein [Nostoc sp.]|uniref:hypothetical protein n=1 Tax=Nostoc sp. TaxID=1180 RepID=UPI002FF676ED